MGTKKVKLDMSCIAWVEGSIEVPDTMSIDEAIKYAKENVDKIEFNKIQNASNVDVSNAFDTTNDASRQGIVELWEIFNKTAVEKGFELIVKDKEIIEQEIRLSRLKTEIGSTAIKKSSEGKVASIELILFPETCKGEIKLVNRRGESVGKYMINDDADVNLFKKVTSRIFDVYNEEVK